MRSVFLEDLRCSLREWICKWFHIHDYNSCSIDEHYGKLYDVWEEECNWCDHMKVTITAKTHDEDCKPINPSISVSKKL